MLKKDKKKVLNEEWSDERIKSFLQAQLPQGESEDFHALVKAYRSMRVEDFERFVCFFTEAGRNLNARGQQGETIYTQVCQHPLSKRYAEALQAAGATT